MTVQNALEEMKERAFAPAFQKYLFDTYKELRKQIFPKRKRTTQRLKTILPPHWSSPRTRS